MRKKEIRVVSDRKDLHQAGRETGELIISHEGEVFSPWWTREVDVVLEALGVPRDDPNRNPWCG